MWLMKRCNKKYSGYYVVLEGGGNISATPCLGKEVME
jgi:hypothetical protein